MKPRRDQEDVVVQEHLGGDRSGEEGRCWFAGLGEEDGITGGIEVVGHRRRMVHCGKRWREQACWRLWQKGMN